MPIRRTKIFSTAVDDQQDVVIKVMEGERALSEGNELLGQLELSGILPAPRGVPKIEVVFELDVRSLLNCYDVDILISRRPTGY